MTTRERIAVTVRGYKLIHELAPGLIVTTSAKALADALLPFVNIYMSARIIDALAAGAGFEAVLTLALLTAAANLVTHLIGRGMARLEDYFQSHFWHVFEEPLNEKLRSMDYERVEDAQVHEKRQRINMARQTNGLGLPRLYWVINEIVGGLCRTVFSIALVAGAFAPFSPVNAGVWGFVCTPWCAALVVLYFLISVAADMRIAVKKNDSFNTMFTGAQSLNRVGHYYYSFLQDYRMGKDLKLYAMVKTVVDEGMKMSRGFIGIMRGMQGILARYGAVSAVLNAVSGVIIYAFVAVKALLGAFGVGGIVQYAGALSQFSSGLSTLMDGLSMLMVNADTLALYFDFTDMPDLKKRGTLTTEKRADNEYEIAFKNVSFKYPGTDAYVLKNLSLSFTVGHRMAVVGMNGSGKTTMIKLLCRLYDPTEGEITLNGIDIRKYDYDEYMAIFSVVFQDFKLFSFPLGQNVAAGVDYDRDRAMECLDKAGFTGRMTSMPRGLDTPLYKDFEEDGVEISGGEAQKIALARALYKNAPFVILDEPTAALDPIAEYEVYSRFNDIAGDKTTVFISHRLSSCRFCDDIAVFHDGELVQRGSHDALLEQEGGKYRELWFAQAQYYSEEGA